MCRLSGHWAWPPNLATLSPILPERMCQAVATYTSSSGFLPPLPEGEGMEASRALKDRDRARSEAVTPQEDYP
jgi:hypothetical protein